LPVHHHPGALFHASPVTPLSYCLVPYYVDLLWSENSEIFINRVQF
jgi:hypothetical protein